MIRIGATSLNILKLLDDLPDASRSEVLETILTRGETRLERIVSLGQITPIGEWYDQTEDEWVLLLAGGAKLLIEGEDEARTLTPGDAILLPAHVRHRVEWTDPAQPTVWLALFVPPASPPVAS